MKIAENGGSEGGLGCRQIHAGREINRALSHLIKGKGSLREMLGAVILFLRRWSGCEAVGIRLQEADDYPYIETVGFHEEFVQTENKLCLTDGKGQPVRDPLGRPVLECMCGNVLCGRIDPKKPFFTEGGSFWTNDATEQLASVPGLRNRCIREGYESVALIPLRAGEETLGLLQFNDRNRGRFTAAWLQFMEEIAENIAQNLLRQRAEEALRRSEAEALRLARENAALAEIGRIISFSLHIGKVYERFAQEAMKLIPSDRVHINLIYPASKKASVHYEAGIKIPGRQAGDSYALQGSVMETVLQTRQGVILLPSNETDLEDLRKRYPAITPFLQVGLRSLIAVPLIHRSQLIGTLHFRSKQYDGYTQRDFRNAESVAHQIAGAVANSQLYLKQKEAEEESRRSGEQLRSLSGRLESIREEERAFIAREIHDELGQVLTAMKMDLSWVAGHLPKNQTALLERMTAISALLDATIQKVRKISTALRPSVLDLGLAAAIEWQVQDFEARTGIQGRFVSSREDFALPDDLSTAVFRIFQETLTNVARHAKASRVDIGLEERGGALILRVRDNGRGITEGEVSSPGSLGILGMRERVHLFGGKIEFRGIAEKGTTVSLQIPIKTGSTASEKVPC